MHACLSTVVLVTVFPQIPVSGFRNQGFSPVSRYAPITSRTSELYMPDNMTARLTSSVGCQDHHAQRQVLCVLTLQHVHANQSSRALPKTKCTQYAKLFEVACACQVQSVLLYGPIKTTAALLLT